LANNLRANTTHPRLIDEQVAMLLMRLWALLVLMMITAQALGQVSIGSLRSSVESSNLEVVTLQGVVHLTRQHQQQLGGRCGGAAFVLTDDTGSIEVAVRRVNRLIEPLKEGDRVRVTAQIEVFRNRDNVPLRICVEATEIQHLDP
jgi:DNA/RNA endonuclease YhcR with UshA esterase domain